MQVYKIYDFRMNGITLSRVRSGHSFLVASIALIFIISPLSDWSLATTPKGPTAEKQGRYVFKVQDDMDVSFQDAEVALTMTLRNEAGDESRRKMKIRFLEVPTDGDKTLITFQYPRDIKGTSLLTHEYIGKNDDQWLYLPALKRVKRIAAKNKTGSFVGSEFSYEDISSNKPQKYSHRYLRQDSLYGEPVWVVERFPKDQNSGYSKIISWVQQSNYQTIKQEFFDRKGTLLKVQSMKNLTQYLGKFWRAREIKMENLQNKKSTILLFDEWKFQQKLQKSDFNTRSLERSR